MPGTVVTNLRWNLEVGGTAAIDKMLAVDRTIRRGVDQTDRAYQKLGATTTTVGDKMSRSSSKVSMGTRREGDAANAAAAYFTELSRRQQETLSISSRLVTANDRVSASYRRQTRAAEEASVKQRAAARLTKVGAGAVGAGAAVGRGVRGTAATAGLGVGGGLVGGIAAVATARQTVDFDRALHNVNSIAQISEKSLQGVGKQLRQIAGPLAKTPTDLANGMYDLVQSDFSAKDSLTILKASAVAATAGMTDTATATKAVAAVLKAYNRPAKDAGNVSDVLFQTVNRGVISFQTLSENIGQVLPFASQMGVSLNQVGAAIATMTKAGIGGENAITYIKNAITAFIKPGKGMQAALDELNTSGQALTKRDGFQGAMEKVIGTTDGSRAAVAKLFPNIRQMSAVFALTGANAKKANEDVKGLSNVMAKGAAPKAFAEQSKSVAVQWDKLKASADSLAIGLGNRLIPAANAAFSTLSSLGNKSSPAGGALAGLSAGLKNLPAQSTVKPRGVGPHDPDSRLAAQSPDQSVSIAQKIGSVARTIGTSALTAGKQLLAAFKPALPFFQNILLPLLEGVGKGVLGSVVVAFKIAIPIITTVSRVLGFIGTAAKPLKGVFEGIGEVVGFVFTGPILKAIGGIEKLGKLGKVIEALGGVFSKLGGLVSKGLGKLAPKALEAFGSLPGHLKDMGIRAGGALVDGLGSLAKTAGKAAGKVGSAIVNAIRNLNFFNLGKRVVNAIVAGIKSLPGAIWNAVKGAAGGAFKFVKKAVTGKRRGGRIGRYADGGLVPAMVSPGEMLAYAGDSMIVPGSPVAADNTLAMVPPGTAVFTSSGQGMLASGASPASVLAMQAPHFAGGGVVRGRVSTFGPPGEKAGTTASGVSSSLAGVAIRPGATWQTGKTTLGKFWQITIGGHTAILKQTDLGPNQSTGRRIDVTGAGARKLGLDPRRFPTDSTGTAVLVGGSATGAAKAGGSGSVPIILNASRTRGGLLDDALSQGISAGTSGLTVSDILAGNRGVRGASPSPILAAVAGAQSATRRQITIPGSKTSSGGLPSGVYTPNTTWNPRRKPIDRWIAPYLTYGASHGWHGIVQSGYRSKAEQAAIYNSGVRPAAKPGTSNHERANYPGGAVDVTQAATLAAILNKRKGPHLLKWAGAKDPVHFSHPHGGSYRRGGIIGRFRTGGVAGAGPTLNEALSAAVSFAGGSFAKLDEAITRAAEAKIEALRAAISKLVRKGGDKKTIQRLQGVLDLIDFEVGRRIGRETDVIAQRSSALDRSQGSLDRTLRKLNISADSTVGLAIQTRADAAAIAVRKQNVASAQHALDLAKRTGDKSAIKDATDQLNQAQDDLDEAVTKHIEDARNAILAVAQAAVDKASFHTDVANNALAGLDITQRLTQTADTPAGMLQKAQAIGQVLIPSLQESLGALETQFQVLAASGDVAGSRQVFLAVQQTGNDIASAMADAADLIRQAGEQAAQDLVDSAGHQTTMADLGEAHLELVQRLNGTFDTASGAQARADYITQNVIPAMQGELAALQTQFAQAQSDGNTKLASQIAEAIGGKQNDILQEQLDVQQQIADNTDPLKDLTGPLGFQAFGQGFTDLIQAGTGA